MTKLERLLQDESGSLRLFNGKTPRYALPSGKLRTVVIKNPCLDVGQKIEEIIERKKLSIRTLANAYLVSEFDSATQHLRRDSKGKESGLFSVYAVQFYMVVQ